MKKPAFLLLALGALIAVHRSSDIKLGTRLHAQAAANAWRAEGDRGCLLRPWRA